MNKEKIWAVMDMFAAEAKRIYGNELKGIILYGSCARGDFAEDSDIDVLVLLNVPPEDIAMQRSRIGDVTDRLDWDYDVVLAPVFQNADVFEKYSPVSAFYQNVRREGVKIA